VCACVLRQVGALVRACAARGAKIWLTGRGGWGRMRFSRVRVPIRTLFGEIAK
jgi:hypothetical protein